jgi:methanogenic corrinoid protein MtbC1
VKDLRQLKHEADGIEEPSEGAVATFSAVFPKLLATVNEMFEVSVRFENGWAPVESSELMRDAHKNFGAMLRAIYEFGLYSVMAEEFAWYISALSSRAIGEPCFRKLIEAWLISIQSSVKPPESSELSVPLEWLRRNLKHFYSLKPDLTTPRKRELDEFLTRILKKQRMDAYDYIASLKDRGYAVSDVYSQIIVPALHEIGLLWQHNEIGVADEHAATEICREVILRLAAEMPQQEPLSYRVLVGCVPGERHDLAANMISNYLQAKGWTVHFLGQSTPRDELMTAIARDNPHAAIFSITLIAHLPDAISLLDRIRLNMPDVKTIVGGRAAIAARSVLSGSCDAIVDRLEETHSVALSLVSNNA